MGITRPTPVQSACIPPILSGRNVIASAETGTGKTAAFVLPILQTLADDPYGICAIILTPTRELAFQISQQLTALGARIAVRQYVLVGGVSETAQAAALASRPHVVIATPGRLAAMLARSAADLSRARFLVLDEADRLLDPTYVPDLKSTLAACTSPLRQTLMFSATMTPTMDALQPLAAGAATDTFRFDARDNRFATVDGLSQHYLFLPYNLKEVNLVHLLKDRFPKQSIIIFTARCETAELLLTMLNLLGMRKVAALHSDMKQTQRIDALQRFKGGVARALIATDVASRGLDIPACEVVLNYDVPRSVATYVHRVGRTARAGREGLAVTFVTQQDVELVHAIEDKVGEKLKLLEKVVEKDVLKMLSATLKARRMARLALIDNGFAEKTEKRRAGSRQAAKKRARAARDGDDNGGGELARKVSKSPGKDQSTEPLTG